jgi:hypothetical protein
LRLTSTRGSGSHRIDGKEVQHWSVPGGVARGLPLLLLPAIGNRVQAHVLDGMRLGVGHVFE